MKLNEKVGRRIREIRVAKGMSVNKLAAEASIDSGQMSKIERGIGSATLDNLNRIASTLGVNVSYIIRVLDSEVCEPEADYDAMSPRRRRIVKLFEKELDQEDVDRLLEHGDSLAELARLKKTGNDS